MTRLIHNDIVLISIRYHRRWNSLSLTEKDAERKQVPLRLAKPLCEELTEWAEEEFRSLNGQIEFLLTDAVRKRHSNST